MHKFFFVILLLSLNYFYLQAQSIQLLCSGVKTSLRGLSAVNDSIIWVSGSNGTVGLSKNGGKHWRWFSVPGFERRDFRDIEAWNDSTALIMAVDEPAVMLKTYDGGYSWDTVFYDTTKGMFLDAFSFANTEYGYVVGDPIHNTPYVAETKNGGNSWHSLSLPFTDTLQKGEAFFAASGSNLLILPGKNDKHYHTYMVTGGTASRLIIDSVFYSLPLSQGEESTGANSIAAYNRTLVTVGGNFLQDTIAHNNCVIITLSKQGIPSFSMPVVPPHGYKSCVTFISSNQLIACGTSGVDISFNGGKHWKEISEESFHVCQKAKQGKRVFLAGNNGKVAILQL